MAHPDILKIIIGDKMPDHQTRIQRKEGGVAVSEFQEGYRRALDDLKEFLDVEGQRADIVIVAMKDGGVEMPDNEEGNALVASMAVKATFDALGSHLTNWKAK